MESRMALSRSEYVARSRKNRRDKGPTMPAQISRAGRVSTGDRAAKTTTVGVNIKAAGVNSPKPQDNGKIRRAKHSDPRERRRLTRDGRIFRDFLEDPGLEPQCGLSATLSRRTAHPIFHTSASTSFLLGARLPAFNILPVGPAEVDTVRPRKAGRSVRPPALFAQSSCPQSSHPACCTTNRILRCATASNCPDRPREVVDRARRVPAEML